MDEIVVVIGAALASADMGPFLDRLHALVAALAQNVGGMVRPFAVTWRSGSGMIASDGAMHEGPSERQLTSNEKKSRLGPALKTRGVKSAYFSTGLSPWRPAVGLVIREWSQWLLPPAPRINQAYSVNQRKPENSGNMVPPGIISAS
ncbi:MAG: hypothetical protein IT430_04225 [Phycisphaerales bacterium]|nr:hypothetical protein [Phycisphaerales bacterium]